MELVVITAERVLPGEGQVLNRLFGEGMERLHLRKPGADEARLRELLTSVRPEYRERIVMHDHFDLVREFGLAGVHLNSRNPEPPGFPVAHVSRSCHSPEEAAEVTGGGVSAARMVAAGKAARFDYVFLSPVFDSISKAGYGQAFSETELLAAKNAGIINNKVYALGGVDINNIPDAARMGFGGVAILGALWEDFLKNSNVNLLSERLNSLRTMARAQWKGCCS